MPNIYRIEKDSIGTKEVPADVYYGVRSLCGAENFPITGLTLHPELINSPAYIKKASAICNGELDIILNPEQMTRPGIAGKTLPKNWVS